MAGNRWDGRLTTTRDGQTVPGEDDDLLTESLYFYHLNSADGASTSGTIEPAFSAESKNDVGQGPKYAVSGDRPKSALSNLDPIVSPEFVLARLACAVLPYAANLFRSDRAERVVTLLDLTTETWTAHRLLSKDVNHRLREEGSKGSKSANPRKRAREEASSLADSFGEEEGQPTERTQEWIADQHHERFLDSAWPIWSGERAGAAGLDLPSMEDRKERALAPIIDQHRFQKACTAEEARILARMASG
ncbi:MAG: hypothetical protein M1826_007275 [Phylliscum demangeonii]|nr:MAG: hypothetical protein M1826_007275 [Phylliscum demangeonii]